MAYLFWLSAIALFLVTMFGLVSSGLLKKWGQRFSERTVLKLIIAISIIIGIVGGSLISGSWFGGTFDYNGSGNDKVAVCAYCKRSWEAGDSGGNFNSIARTKLCKNCYNNYKWGQEALGD